MAPPPPAPMPPLAKPRPAEGTSPRTFMNWVLAWNVVFCPLVPTSPDTCVRPCDVSAPNAIGMWPVELKKLMMALPAFDWLLFSPLNDGAVGPEPEPGSDPPPDGDVKSSVRLR